MKVSKINGIRLATVLLLVASGCIVLIWLIHDIQANRLKRLLSGDTEVEIGSLTIHDRDVRIELEDADAMKYLSSAFRSAVNEGYIPTHIGPTNYADVNLKSIGSVQITFNIVDNGNGVNIGYPMYGLDDPTYYWVPLPEPRPNSVEVAIKRIMGVSK